MSHLALLVLCAAAALPGRCRGADGEVPEDLQQAPEGQCAYFKDGGLLHMQHYVCCNDCDENNGQPVCGKTTYLASAKGAYCGPCGQDLGAGEPVSTFRCGGCEGQAAVRERCDKRYIYAGAAFCWLHSKCLELRCERAALAAAQGDGSDDEPYCGDGRCDRGRGEDGSSCPFDCCPYVNDTECRHPHHCSKCPPVCCAEPGCCLD
ncbi:uncharacterized protein LOC118429969 [Branchiostoma floridae]|uniref:Uncharacterized protein LOC118429969 n=1 Tax=Branchiostoma floridae TaxID=7739 RepID=C3XTP4_BRAFL|nr:uncharacterized protein LOC118429969 [Branchiostoma floridae]|eukprot:XP_002612661.1 hypothetical protein BRAFLDRAFT_78708 [Branchiostoma floridae]